ncbi:MAG: hypothetical protein IIA88_00660, partial [Bacteroidetes bacterium]|nr:hypothetical protein [Bacteroidota bacterium]
FMTARWAFEAMAVNQVMNNQFEKPYFQLEKQESIGNFKQVYYIPTLEDKVYEINELNDELLKELPLINKKGLLRCARKLL